MYTHAGDRQPSGTSSFDTRYASSVACMHANSAPGHILVVILPESRISALVELVRLVLDRPAANLWRAGQGASRLRCARQRLPAPRARPVLSHRRPAAPKRGACWTPARSHRQPAARRKLCPDLAPRPRASPPSRKACSSPPKYVYMRTFRTTPSHALSETSTITLAPRLR